MALFRRRRALAAAREIEPSRLEPARSLKISGISIALASLLESEHDHAAAYKVYSEALDELLRPSTGQDAEARAPSLTPQERLRTVSLAQKLGDIASSGAITGEELAAQNLGTAGDRDTSGIAVPDLNAVAERHYVWSVEELLRIVMSEGQRQEALSADQRGEQGGIILADLQLPPAWGLTHSELGASMEALGSFYAGRGKADLAVPLYLQALSILMPPPDKKGKTSRSPTASERCHAGILMNNLSQLLVNGVPKSPINSQQQLKLGPEGGPVAQAQSWAEKGLAVVQATQRMAGWSSDAEGPTKEIVKSTDERADQVKRECAAAEVTLLYNLGVLSEVRPPAAVPDSQMLTDIMASQLGNDKCKAREHFSKAYARSQDAGLRDARNRSAQALSNLERSQLRVHTSR